MRPFVFVAAAAVLLAGSALPALASSDCSIGRQTCESVCTPDRLARYYFGSLRRCTASCEPRWQQCLRTGIWIDLERRLPPAYSAGW